MPWNNQGGGPWGSGQGPWGGRSGGNEPGKKPNGTGGGPGDLDDILQQIRQFFGGLLPPGGGNAGALAGLAAVCVVALWVATGFYRVLPDEQGVVLRFGAYTQTTGPGLHYHLPYPIEDVLKPKVTRVNRTDVGMDSQSEVPGEALMLTGDENIVDVNLSVFWVITDAKAYLFNVRNVDGTVKSATEGAIREVVGQTPIASILAQGRADVEAKTRVLLQHILDSYGAGIQITEVQLLKADPPQPVIESFRDVQRARTDMERLQNEAQAYANDVVPRARGDASKTVQGAQAYAQQSVANAQGAAKQFDQIYQAWKVAKQVTSERLYLETMEGVLKNAHKIVIDPDASKAGVLPYLPLSQLAPGPGQIAGNTPAPAASTDTSTPDAVTVSAPPPATTAAGQDQTQPQDQAQGTSP